MSKLYQDVLAEAVTHADLVISASREMAEACDSWLVKDMAGVAEHRREVEHLEEQANGVKTRVLTTIAEAETEDKRTDLLQLVQDVDALADQAEGVTYRLNHLDYQPSPELRDQFKDMALVTIKGVELIAVALAALTTGDISETLAATKQIHLQENSANDIFLALEAEIFTKLDLDVRMSIQVRNLAVRLEAIGKRAKAVADEIRVITSRR